CTAISGTPTRPSAARTKASERTGSTSACWKRTRKSGCGNWAAPDRFPIEPQRAQSSQRNQSLCSLCARWFDTESGLLRNAARRLLLSHQLAQQRGGGDALAAAGGDVERRAAGAILDVQPGAVRDEETDHRVSAPAGGAVQRRVARVVGG